MSSRLSVRIPARPVLTHEMRESTESELVAASLRGDCDAFGELVRRCGTMVDAVAYAATRDRTLADDIAQDTFVAAWRDLGRLRDASAVRPWLCKIARNLAHKARRRRAHEGETDNTVDAEQIAAPRTPYDALHERDVERLVDAALAQVPAPYRETLVLFYFEQQSAKAVADALGIREDVVHQRLSRGRRHLAAAFESHVATTLTRRRRSRRDLAAAVLAALALVPRSVHASTTSQATRGLTMLKVGAAAIAVATVGLTSFAVRAAADAAPPSAPSRRVVTVTKTTPASRPRITPATAPSARASSSCTTVVQHIIDLSFAALESAAEFHKDGIARVRRELEERCRREPWSAREIACMQAAQPYSDALAKCRPAPPREPVEGPPAPVGADVDVSCARVGAHMADLIIESSSLDDLNNVASVALLDFTALPAEAVQSCIDYKWSLDLRRCYAASDRYTQTVACNLRWR
jgi:RNA polymerase sigma factor (sigma-70 family)